MHIFSEQTCIDMYAEIHVDISFFNECYMSKSKSLNFERPAFENAIR